MTRTHVIICPNRSGLPIEPQLPFDPALRACNWNSANLHQLAAIHLWLRESVVKRVHRLESQLRRPQMDDTSMSTSGCDCIVLGLDR